MIILAQILGFLAIICWVISIQQKNKEKILICQIIANGLYGIEYFLLNAMSASIMNFISFTRCFVFYDDLKKNKKTSKYSLIFFSIILIIVGIFTYNNILSLIPIIIGLFYTYSLWQDNINVTKYIYIIGAIIWIYYNFKVQAYIGILGNILEIISGIISLKMLKKKIDNYELHPLE